MYCLLIDQSQITELPPLDDPPPPSPLKCVSDSGCLCFCGDNPDGTKVNNTLALPEPLIHLPCPGNGTSKLSHLEVSSLRKIVSTSHSCHTQQQSSVKSHYKEFGTNSLMLTL